MWVGVPDLNFIKGMRAEHCSRKDSREIFETSNYKIKTCPMEEWNLVVGEASHHFVGNKGSESMLAKATREGKMGNERRIPQLEDLKSLDLVKTSALREEEVLAVVLYTGPMVSVNF